MFVSIFFLSFGKHSSFIVFIIDVDRRFHILMPIIVIKFIVSENASIFFKDWDFLCHTIWTEQIVDFILVHYSTIKKACVCAIHWIRWLCWFYFQFLKCYCFGSTWFIFVLFLFSSLLLLLMLYTRLFILAYHAVCLVVDYYWFALVVACSFAQWTSNHHIVHSDCCCWLQFNMFARKRFTLSIILTIYFISTSAHRLCIQGCRFNSFYAIENTVWIIIVLNFFKCFDSLEIIWTEFSTLGPQLF